MNLVAAIDCLLLESPETGGVAPVGGTSAIPGLYFQRSNDQRDWRSRLQMDFEHLQPGQEFRIQAQRIFIRQVHHHRASGYDPVSREPRILTYDIDTDTASLWNAQGDRIARSKLLAL